ncbi:MAG: FG-GAP-like repeat-containing protein [Desulfurivibrio sp.]|nr:FG-GAP-like repeat-containing protein [Desulfurivibrio sp.]
MNFSSACRRRFAAGFFCLIVVTLFCSLPRGASAAAEPPPKIAVLPFELLAPQDMAYLVEGVRTMLTSRLAAGGAAEVLERGAVRQAATAIPDGNDELRQLGRQLAVAYLVSGRITAVGEGVSLDVKVHDLEKDQGARSFFASAASAGEVIPAVDSLAREIRQEMLASTPTSAAAGASPDAAAPSVAEAPTADRQPASQPEYSSPHPERQLRDRWSGGSSQFIRADEVSWLRGYSRSHTLPLGMRALETADVTGDGELEFIVAGANQVEVYRREMGRFTRIGQVQTLNRYAIHYLSAGDLNDNGRAEIYVSAADHRGPNSLVLEWEGDSLQRLYNKLPYYIRAMRLPMSGPTLVGQGGGGGSFLASGMFRLQAEGDKLRKAGPVSGVPGNFSLFDFVYADLDGDGAEEMVAINQNDRLEVYNAAGGRLWRSGEYFGGTTRILGGVDPETMEETTMPHEKSRHYVPSRIIIRDVDDDGLPDVVVVKNIDSLSRIMGRLRAYSGGEIHALRWEGGGLNEIWRTRRIEGYIADIQMGPDQQQTNEDGETIKGAELFVGVVLGSNGLNIFANAESVIYAYPVEYKPRQE